MEQNKRIRKIVNSIKQPSKNCIWLKDGKLYYYGTTGWTEIQGQDKVTGVATTWTDLDGMKYQGSPITKFPDGLKFAPRTGRNCIDMFSNCTKLTEVSLFDTSKATNTQGMFYYCNQLAAVPEFDTSSVTNMSFMFYYCSKITSVPEYDTSNVTNMSNLFKGCSQLESIPLFDTSKVNDMSNMFFGCGKLTNLGGFIGLKARLDLSGSPLLTHDSLLNVINEAADVTASPKTLTLGATNLAKLTDEEKAIATSKGWTLA